MVVRGTPVAMPMGYNGRGRTEVVGHYKNVRPARRLSAGAATNEKRAVLPEHGALVFFVRYGLVTLRNRGV